jgi:hypothetical protein
MRRNPLIPAESSVASESRSVVAIALSRIHVPCCSSEDINVDRLDQNLERCVLMDPVIDRAFTGDDLRKAEPGGERANTSSIVTGSSGSF